MEEVYCDEARANQPYFGTIMRSGSKVFDDSLDDVQGRKTGKRARKI
ncbi:MAG: DUF5037 domain-containing protein [Coprococcus phoceensis]